MDELRRNARIVMLRALVIPLAAAVWVAVLANIVREVRAPASEATDSAAPTVCLTN